MIWIVDAHLDEGKRFVVHADEILTALLGFFVLNLQASMIARLSCK